MRTPQRSVILLAASQLLAGYGATDDLRDLCSLQKGLQRCSSFCCTNCHIGVPDLGRQRLLLQQLQPPLQTRTAVITCFRTASCRQHCVRRYTKVGSDCKQSAAAKRRGPSLAELGSHRSHVAGPRMNSVHAEQCIHTLLYIYTHIHMLRTASRTNGESRTRGCPDARHVHICGYIT